MGRSIGVTDRQLLELGEYPTSDAFDELDRLCLAYADAATRTPVQVEPALFARLREHLTDEQLIELTAAVAWENSRARFAHALGVEPNDYSEGAACAVPAGAA